MKELKYEQEIVFVMTGGSWYTDIVDQLLKPITDKGVPPQSIKHIYDDICDCEGNNPFCAGKSHIAKLNLN